VARSDSGAGVPFAVDDHGRVIHPTDAQHRERFYRCLACHEHVFLRAGKVRVAHFAHYTHREMPCSAETVLHEAAKYRLAELLREGMTAIQVRAPCHGYTDAYNNARDCTDSASANCVLMVPAHDSVHVEVGCGPYRLDAAALLADEVVLGLEVYQSNAVDATKQAYLKRSRLPWLELSAHDVLYEPMPWTLHAGSVDPYQCPVCSEEAAASARQRALLEERARRAAEEERRRQKLERFRNRNFRVARQGRKLVYADSASPGSRATCLVCKQVLLATRINKKVYWSHANGYECDTRRGWIYAGMLALYTQLKTEPEDIKILRRCEGSRYGDCRNYLVDRLPTHDSVKGSGMSLVLRHKGGPVAQITFGEDYVVSGAPRTFRVFKPSRLLNAPTVLYQPRDGRYCPSCIAKRTQRQAERIARGPQAVVAVGLHDLESEPHDPPARETTRCTNALARGYSDEERTRAIKVAREQLEVLGINPWLAAGYSVTLRICKHCQQETVTVEPYGLRFIPRGLDNLLDDSASHIRAQCANCGGVTDIGRASEGIPVSSARLLARP
jgi:hypothetical protein